MNAKFARRMSLIPLFLSALLCEGALAATSVTWSSANNWGSFANTEAKDFTGDGIADLASATPVGLRMKISTGAGFIEEAWTAGSQWSPGGFTVSGDFDGDGRNDIASCINGIVYVKLNRGTVLQRFDEFAWPVANTWGTANYLLAADFNGDGKDDIASPNAGTVHMKLSTGSGFTSVNWPVANTWGSGGFTFAGDFNGDGKADIASANAGTVHMKLSTGSGFTSVNWPVLNAWGSSGYAVAGDFNGDGKNDIASANAGSVLLKLSTGTGFTAATWSVANLYGTSGWIFGADFTGDGLTDIASPNATNVYMKLNDPVIQAESTRTANRYYVRAGDINGDGFRDLFVTGNTGRNVPNFILQRATNGDAFTVIATPTSTQVQAAQQWPVSNIAVFREDLNFDGYFDFYLEYVREAVAGASDVIVYTLRNVGNTPGKAVSLDWRFRWIQDKIHHALTTVGVLHEFYAQTCITSYSPSLVLPTVPYDWIFSGAPDDWYRDRYIFIFDGIAFSNGFAQAIPSQTCYVHGQQEPAEYKKFVRAAGDWLGLTAGTCIECQIRARQILTGQGGWVISTGAVLTQAARISRAAWILTGVLVADDATVVGAADDVLLPVIVLVGAGAELTQVLVRVISESQPPDVGPKSDPDESNGSDPFEKPPGYDPNDPDFDHLEDLTKPGGSSKVLGDNLKRRGYPKPANSHAHHVVRKAPDNQYVQESQEMLNRNNIHLDQSSNGGWLPEDTEAAARAGTRATPHSRVHTPWADEVTRDALRAIEEQYGPGNAEAPMRALLQDILDAILDGTWPPPGPPI